MKSIANATSLALPTSLTAARRRIVQALYREYSSRLVDFAALHVRDEDAAEDIVQSAFASILAGRFPVPAVDVDRKLEEIVRRHCAAHRKARAHQRATKSAFREAHERSERTAWRSWRSGLARRGDPRDEHNEDGEERQ